jgi:hypothetical protein
MARLTSTEKQSLQLGYGMVYVNYGEATQRKLGPTKGGTTLTVTQEGHYIEFDGASGKEKDTYVVDAIMASLTTVIKSLSQEDLMLAIPFATIASDIITVGRENVGLMPAASYLTNITVFGRMGDGQLKKATLYNAAALNGLSAAFVPKGEGEYQLVFDAHLDGEKAANLDLLVQIEDVANISDDVSAPTVVTVPADAATAIVVSANLTATFNEPINSKDVKAGNFVLVKASDGSIVAGALTYNATTRVATFDPTASLTGATPYIWTIANVRDLAGNVLATTVVNFTTA